jgi:hypothetical protein
VIRVPGAGRWLALLTLVGITTLYADAIQTRFLNDDYLFLEDAQRPLSESIGSLGPLGNYYRPFSRQLTFEALTLVARDQPLIFHVFGFLLFLVSLALLADLLRVWLPPTGVWAGTLYFALLPFQRVNLMWISCVQDLVALALALGSVALFRRGRNGLSALAYLLAVFSKESALPLPLALLAFQRWGPAAPETAEPSAKSSGRYAPFALVAAIWCGVTLWIRARHVGEMPLSFHPESFAAAYVHGIQSLLGLDYPPTMGAALFRHGPHPGALALLASATLLLPSERHGPRSGRSALLFGLSWIGAFTFVVGPVADSWSSYYYTLAAVGAALLVGLLFSKASPATLLLLVGGLLWWHAGATAVRAFATARDPWVWSSHLTPFYFQRAAAYSDTLSAQLLRLEPRPQPDTRFFFATLPSWAGFQMGNGARIGFLYRDPSIQSYFYSQFSESTAAFAPCRFLQWDGLELRPLLPPGTDVFFQVGSDLLALDRLHGARHAFRRGLLAGESRADLLYWLGWTELWLGRRGMAEAAWSASGARDDSVAWHMQMRQARSALVMDRDTLRARRGLAAAIQLGIGRPEAHAILGSLLLPSRPKYGLLELKVALSLNPLDWVARREVILELVRQRLDQQAWTELARLAQVRPDWRSDSALAAAARELDLRSSAGGAIEF